MRRHARLGQAGGYIMGALMTIDVRVSQEPDYHEFAFGISIQPQGKTKRYAYENEVIVRLQDRHLTTWRTIEQEYTGFNGLATIRRIPRLNVGDYRLTAQHLDSDAEVAREFSILSDFTFGTLGAQYVVREGTEMPASFEQAQPSMVGWSTREHYPGE